MWDQLRDISYDTTRLPSSRVLKEFLPSAGNFPRNVILLVLDGVRWQEVFLGADPNLIDPKDTDFKAEFPIFRNLNQLTSQYGFMGGNRSEKQGPLCPMEISNLYAMSLSGYQSIFGGFNPIFAFSNYCGRIKKETFPERLIRKGRLEKQKVACFASWKKMHHAVESQSGRIYVNAGPDPVLVFENSETKELNCEQERNLPVWSNARYDQYTWAHSIQYLKEIKPRFLFIGLQDSDEWGHLGLYKQYLNTLKYYDHYILELFQVLSELGSYGKATTVFITTDHGRGPSRRRWSGPGNWKGHGWLNPESKHIWFYGRDVGSQQSGILKTPHPHLHIGPTVEAILAPQRVEE